MRARPDGSHRRPPEYRYGVVFVLMLALLVFAIVAPTAAWSRAVGLALEGAALVVAVGTSRAGRVVRRRRAAAGLVVALVAVAGVASGLVPAEASLLLSGLLALAIPLALGGGLLRLVREHGVTLHAVAGTLAIYLLVGLLFAWTIGFVTRVDSAPYFAQGTSGTDSQRVVLQLHRADDDGVRGPDRRDARRSRARGPRDAGRPALPRDRDRAGRGELPRPSPECGRVGARAVTRTG